MAAYIFDKLNTGGELIDILAKSDGANVKVNCNNEDKSLNEALGDIYSSITEATSDKAGLMSADDKKKLDGLRRIFVGTGDAPADMVEGDIFIKKI